MPEIKTRDAVKGTIKTLDKAVIAGDRMKQVYVRTKDKAENSISASERNPEEYASDRISGMLMPWFMRQFISLTGMAVKRSKPRRIISTAKIMDNFFFTESPSLSDLLRDNRFS